MNAIGKLNAVTELDPPIMNPDFPPMLHLLQIPSGDSQLVGRMFSPQGSGPHPLVILLHGFPGSQFNHDMAAYLQELGYHALVFHYRGAWGSTGEFSIVHALEDVRTVLAYLRQAEIIEKYDIDTGRIALVGHSFGGFLGLMTAANDPAIAACASISGANYGAIGTKLSDPGMINRYEEAYEYAARFLTGYTSQKLASEVLEHFEQWNLADCAPKLAACPVLLIGAGQDAVLPAAEHHVPLVQAFEQLDRAKFRHLLFEAAGHGYEGKRKSLCHAIGEWLAQVIETE